MAESKKYYWLQLKEEFFRQKEIKLLRRIAGGDTYTIIYQKMMLMSLKDGGKIFYEGVADDFAEEIALEIDEDIENVKMTISFLMSKGLLKAGDNEAFMCDVPNLIGSETDSARRVRKHRQVKNLKQKLLQCNTDVTKGNTDIDIEIDKDIDIDINTDKEKEPKREAKHKYGEYQRVLLTDSELDRLNSEYGDPETQAAIKFLDEYIEEKDYKSKSHNLALRRWVFDAVKRDKAKRKQSPTDFYNEMEEWVNERTGVRDNFNGN